jgi:hypothetical protein
MKSKDRFISISATKLQDQKDQDKNIYIFDATEGAERKNNEFVFFEERVNDQMMIDMKELLENYLSAGKILIAIDSNVEGVVLPDHLMHSIQVKLNLSYRFATEIFEIDHEKVKIDLSFAGSRFLCSIPFDSIYYVALAADPLNGVEIIENMPIELLELSYQLETQAEKNKEIQGKQIDFLTNIPPDKAEKIEKNINISTKSPKKSPKKSSKKELEDRLFNDFMKLVSEYDIQEQLKNISDKTHRQNAKSSKKKKNPIDNEIDFTQFLEIQAKDQKQ